MKQFYFEFFTPVGVFRTPTGTPVDKTAKEVRDYMDELVAKVINGEGILNLESVGIGGHYMSLPAEVLKKSVWLTHESFGND